MNESKGVALVTGAGRGIGAAISRKLASSGWHACVVDVSEARATEQAERLRSEGLPASARVCDVGDFEQVGELVSSLEAEAGPITALVNNAGITRDAMFHKMDLDDWGAVLHVNLSGAFHTVRHVAPLMRERRSGRIVNIASRAILGNMGQANYSASKAGLVGLTRTLALELGRYDVTANVVCPGFTETEMTAAMPEEARAKVVSQIPLGRPGKPEDIANAVYFFCGDLGSYVTGAVLHVGGGRELASVY